MTIHNDWLKLYVNINFIRTGNKIWPNQTLHTTRKYLKIITKMLLKTHTQIFNMFGAHHIHVENTTWLRSRIPTKKICYLKEEQKKFFLFWKLFWKFGSLNGKEFCVIEIKVGPFYPTYPDIFYTFIGYISKSSFLWEKSEIHLQQY